MKNKYYLIILVVAFVGILAFSWLYFKDETAIIETPKNEVSNTPIDKELPKPQIKEEPKFVALPSSYLIKNFPFETQAPNANWDELHEEACEEASVILANYYLKKQKITPEIMDDEIHKMVNWQVKKWGSHKDLTIKETAQMAKEIYGLKTDTITISSIEDLKREIAEGNPIIVPTAGRRLGNPNFKQPGPVYHMVVVIGYDNTKIIVQDVGTRKGDHYEYSQTVFYNAIHDWNGDPESINDGPKRILKILD